MVSLDCRLKWLSLNLRKILKRRLGKSGFRPPCSVKFAWLLGLIKCFLKNLQNWTFTMWSSHSNQSPLKFCNLSPVRTSPLKVFSHWILRFPRVSKIVRSLIFHQIIKIYVLKQNMLMIFISKGKVFFDNISTVLLTFVLSHITQKNISCENLGWCEQGVILCCDSFAWSHIGLIKRICWNFELSFQTGISS